MDNEEIEFKILIALSNYRNFLNSSKIAQLILVPLRYVEKVLDQLEKRRYVIITPQKRIKQPHELLQEYAKKGRKPLEIYKTLEKEYRITEAGMNYYNTLKGKKDFVFSFYQLISPFFM